MIRRRAKENAGRAKPGKAEKTMAFSRERSIIIKKAILYESICAAEKEEENRVERNHVIRKMIVVVLAAALVFPPAGCTKSVHASAYQEEEAADAIVPEEDTVTIYEYPVYSHETDDPYYLPACRYIMENCGSQYDAEDIMIPFVNILRVDDSDPEDILVWGNYKVINYEKCGSTLLVRSGGSYPGLIHMRRDGDSIAGVSMDVVKDGSDEEGSIEEIFGVDEELLEAYRRSNAYEEDHEIVLNTLRWYREDTGLAIEAYEDYGSDPVFLDEDEEREPEYPDREVSDGETEEYAN